jgi:uncharacterized protein YjbI with pentapeptide repeats
VTYATGGLLTPDLAALPYAKYLQPFDGPPEIGEDYSEAHVDAVEFDEVRAGGMRFSESAWTTVTFAGGDFDRARLDDVWVSKCRWIGGSWAETSFLNVTVLDSVLAGVQAYGSQWRRVVIRDCKIDSLNLRGARLRDVEFRDCELTEVDFGDAVLDGVTFPGTALRRARFAKATARRLDFRAARELDVAQGWESLRGAVIGEAQLGEAAPALAQTLGIVIR